MKEVLKRLDEMEIKWTERQKEKEKEKEKKVKVNEFIDHLLTRCKEHNRPLTSVDDLKALVKDNLTNSKNNHTS